MINGFTTIKKQSHTRLKGRDAVSVNNSSILLSNVALDKNGRKLRVAHNNYNEIAFYPDEAGFSASANGAMFAGGVVACLNKNVGKGLYVFSGVKQGWRIYTKESAA